MKIRCVPIAALLVGLLALVPAPAAEMPGEVYVVPNFHPACCGWLTDFSTERNYCLNSYLDHLDRVRDDPNYRFVMSEVPHLIAMHDFEPQRLEELKRRVREGRVEMVNAFFLEPTINLSGGEALVKQGVEGIRWQSEVLGVRPRFCWMIDVCGMHEQMAQIVSGLGLDALVYCRLNPTGSTIHWMESYDGSRTLALSPGHYLEWRPVFATKTPLTPLQLQQLGQDLQARFGPLPGPQKTLAAGDLRDLATRPRYVPKGAPVLILGGSGDYSLAPLCPQYPSEFLRQWKQTAGQTDVRFSTLSSYYDAVAPRVRSGQLTIPSFRGATPFTYNAFWIQNPTVKQWFRRDEQALQAAETLASIAGLKTAYAYPAQPLYHAWLMMLLNMDRNTLWGAAGGMVFEHPTSWDVRDRFEYVDTLTAKTHREALSALLGHGRAVGLFNPLNWNRHDPFWIKLPSGSSLAGAACQAPADDAQTLCQLELPSVGAAGLAVAQQAPAALRTIDGPPRIETKHYVARIDPTTGAIVSLKVKPSGRELLAGPANVLVAERPIRPVGPGDHMLLRPQRRALASSSEFPGEVSVRSGPLATIVEVRAKFYGGAPSRRRMVFYTDYPRIDFETELQDIPDNTVVVAEFPLARQITGVRRGIPYGFSQGLDGIAPAVRWSHYTLSGGGGMAILDRGLPGREVVDNVPLLYLLSAVEKYRGFANPWLSGRGQHRLSYAIVAHDGAWTDARVPQWAWEFNCPPVVVPAVEQSAPRSFLRTSANLVLEVVRREGEFLEARMAECFGQAGSAEVTLDLPHTAATLTNLLGQQPQPLPGGPSYRFSVRPQQIVTIRMRTAAAVEAITPLLSWRPLVPVSKREALDKRLHLKGHPPEG
jgi:alpha-mannosidase